MQFMDTQLSLRPLECSCLRNLLQRKKQFLGFFTPAALFGVQQTDATDLHSGSQDVKLVKMRIKAEMNAWHSGECVLSLMDLDCLSLHVSTPSSLCNISALINYTAITSSPLMVYLLCEIMTAFRAWFKSPIYKSPFIVRARSLLINVSEIHHSHDLIYTLTEWINQPPHVFCHNCLFWTQVMQVPLPFWNFLILARCHSGHSYAIFIKRWEWILSIFSISKFAASIKLLLGFSSACYPERRIKTSVDGSAELCYYTFSTAVYGCNNKVDFMTPTRGNGNSEREQNKSGN